MNILALTPMLLSTIFVFRWGVWRAFLGIYLPCLLLFPSIYQAPLRGLPDLNFFEAAVIPIFVAYLATEAHKWRFTVADFLLLIYALWHATSEFATANPWQAQAILRDSTLHMLVPYILAKGLIEAHKGRRMQFARRVAFLFFLNAVSMLHALTFGFSLYDRVFRHLFPGTEHAIWYMQRLGLPRLRGAFGHAISAGLALAGGYRVMRWVQWNQGWEKRFSSTFFDWMSKATLMRIGFILMILATLSRGPWVGAALGAYLAGVSVTKKPANRLIWRLINLVPIAVFGYCALRWYSSFGSETALSGTVAYRWNLANVYWDAMLTKPIYGWGLTNWPFEGHLSSIDNFYLFIAVQRGIVGFSLLFLVLLWPIIRLIKVCAQIHRSKEENPHLAYTLLGIIILTVVTAGTVWMDRQQLSIFLLYYGWTEALLLLKPKAQVIRKRKRDQPLDEDIPNVARHDPTALPN